MPAGDKGGVIGLKPPATRAIPMFQHLMHSLIVTNPKMTARARKLGAQARRKRGRR